MADSEGQVYKHADADSLIQKFQSSLWDQEEAVGSETVFSSKGFSNGRCVFSKRNLYMAITTFNSLVKMEGT